MDFEKRIKNALILLGEGHSYKVGELFLTSNEVTFCVTGSTVTNNPSELTRNTAVRELNEIKEIFSKMVKCSLELSNFVSTKELEFLLVDDYGMGSMEICREKGGVIEWISILKNE